MYIIYIDKKILISIYTFYLSANIPQTLIKNYWELFNHGKACNLLFIKYIITTHVFLLLTLIKLLWFKDKKLSCI